jgi:hypothetical protein
LLLNDFPFLDEVLAYKIAKFYEKNGYYPFFRLFYLYFQTSYYRNNTICNIAVLPNYKKYMSTMADISKSNPELDPKECASLAFVDMVINFVLDQVNVVKYDKIQGTISPAAIAL